MNFSSDSSNFITSPDTSSWFKVIATNTLGCYISDSIFIKVNHYPTYDSVWTNNPIIFLGQESDLNISTSDNIIWSTNDSDKTVEIFPDVSDWYNVLIYNNYCQLTDSIFIEVKDVFCNKENIIIPNAFSPNEDGKNENYKIIDEDGIITSFRLEIFNRFGEKVFSSENINESWDGYYKGKLLSPQVFDFYLEIECVGNKSLFEKGNITLIR